MPTRFREWIRLSMGGGGKSSTQRSQPMPAIRLVRLLLVSCAAAYVVVCLIVAYYQRSYIYFPHVRASQQVDVSARSERLDRWNKLDGQAIGMKRLSVRQPADGQVLITYGNGSSAVSSAHYADEIQNLAALDVFILEYPGYADRAGSPSQTSIFRAADDAFQSLDMNKPVYLVGESLGSGVASYLAGKYPGQVAGLILLSPFDRLTNVAQEHMPYLPVRLLMLDRFASEDYLHDYHGPVGIMVDGRDEVVPEKFGVKLYESYAGPKRLWTFADGGHVSIMESPAKFWREVMEFWRTNHGSHNSTP
jgi:pimeloyl-ACP methyl ester carboxylesterase